MSSWLAIGWRPNTPRRLPANCAKPGVSAPLGSHPELPSLTVRKAGDGPWLLCIDADRDGLPRRRRPRRRRSSRCRSCRHCRRRGVVERDARALRVEINAADVANGELLPLTCQVFPEERIAAGHVDEATLLGPAVASDQH